MWDIPTMQVRTPNLPMALSFIKNSSTLGFTKYLIPQRAHCWSNLLTNQIGFVWDKYPDIKGLFSLILFYLTDLLTQNGPPSCWGRLLLPQQWGGLGEMDPLHLRRFVIVEKLDVCYAGEGMFPQPSAGLSPSFPCPRTRRGLSNRFPTQKQTISVTMWRQLCFLTLMGMWYTPHPRPAFHIHEYVTCNEWTIQYWRTNSWAAYWASWSLKNNGFVHWQACSLPPQVSSSVEAAATSLLRANMSWES